jgi:alpha-tubulin suppressor-like RCC1 family protein
VQPNERSDNYFTLKRAVGGFALSVAIGVLLTNILPVVAGGTLNNTPVAKAIAAGGAHACAIYNTAGQVYCWGENDRGQLGNGTNIDSSVPVAVDMSGLLSGLTVKKVAAGFAHTCVIAGVANSTASDAVYCWGAGDKGQLGNGSVADSNVPVAVGGALMSLSAGEVVGEVYAGFATTCAVVVSGGATYCWGDNDEGQYGNNTTTSSNTPVLMVSSWDNVSDLAIGMNHTCAVLNMMVLCSGAGADGQLGNQSNNDSLTPVTVPFVGHDDVTSISAGFFFSCAMTTRALFYCWGDDSSGQLGGNGGTNTATLLKDFGDEKSRPIASGYAHSCAGFECIGENGSGQLGDGTTVSKSAMTAVDTSGVLNGLTAKSISAGFDFTCWIAGGADNDFYDAVYCTGAGVDGQLGDNSTANSSVPVAVDTTNVTKEDVYIMLGTSEDAITLSPVPNGNADVASLDLTVVTNNSNGYNLTIKTDEVNLVCGDGNSDKIVPQSADGSLETNAWGFGVGASEPTAWKGIEASAKLIASGAAATDDSGISTKVWFGVKVDYLTAVCNYSGEVMFSAVATI